MYTTNMYILFDLKNTNIFQTKMHLQRRLKKIQASI